MLKNNVSYRYILTIILFLFTLSKLKKFFFEKRREYTHVEVEHESNKIDIYSLEKKNEYIDVEDYKITDGQGKKVFRPIIEPILRDIKKKDSETTHIKDVDTTYIQNNDVFNPLDQFEIRDYVKIELPILFDIKLSLTNIGGYATTGTILILTIILLSYNLNKIIYNK